MDLKQIKDFVKLAKKEGVSSLKYESGNLKLSVSLPTGEVVSRIAPAAQVETAMPAPAQAKKKQENLHEVRSPFVGTFYRSPAPNEPLYVSVGDKVSPGKILCILEAMKIMNEIECDVSGEVVEVCTENESLVEFGQVLFKIRKS